MKKILVLLVFLLVLVGAYVAYPYYSMTQLGDAVKEGDQTRLEALVDWPSVRQGLKDDLNVLLAGSMAQSAGGKSDALAKAFLAMLGPKLIENVVDSYATPAGFAALIKSGGKVNVAATSRQSGGEITPKDKDATSKGGAIAAQGGSDAAQSRDSTLKVKSARFVALDVFEIVFDNPKGDEGVSLVGLMKLQGLSWKLTRLMLPVDELLKEKKQVQPQN